MKIRCIIVDDDDAQIENLERELNKWREIEVVRRYNDSTKFLLEQKKIDYDLVFLDIEMPILKGISIPENIEKLVIFISAYRKEYDERLWDLVNSSPKILGSIDKANLSSQLPKTLNKLIFQQKQRGEFLYQNFEGGLKKIKQNEILFITVLPDDVTDRRDKRLFKTAANNYEEIKIKNANIKDIAASLNEIAFFHVNEHFIISRVLAETGRAYSDHIFIELPKKIRDIALKQLIAVDKQEKFRHWLRK